MPRTKGSVSEYYNLAKYMWGILVVLALLSRIIIPVGMMPDFQSQGIFKLTICSGDGMKTINVLAGDYSAAGHSDQKKNNEPCPYAVGLNTATLVLAVLILIALEMVRVLFIGSPVIRLSSATRFSNIYPRAPPCLS